MILSASYFLVLLMVGACACQAGLAFSDSRFDDSVMFFSLALILGHVSGGILKAIAIQNRVMKEQREKNGDQTW